MRNLLVVQRQQASRESTMHQKQVKKGSAKQKDFKQSGYNMLRRTRDINKSVQELDKYAARIAIPYRTVTDDRAVHWTRKWRLTAKQSCYHSHL
jgi:hypothetical protein